MPKQLTKLKSQEFIRPTPYFKARIKGVVTQPENLLDLLALRKVVFKWCQKAAKQGDLEAKYALGDCYHMEIGVDKNDASATKYYKEAIAQGYAQDHQCDLVDCCYKREQEIANYNNDEFFLAKFLFKWCQKAAEQEGDPQAQCALGYCYSAGVGVGKDDKVAFKCYKMAAEQGEPQAQYNLGNCYMRGEGIDINQTYAVELYEKAAKQGHVISQINLGDFYHIKKDDKTAFKWYKLAAEQGEFRALQVVCNSYIKGIGVDIDHDAAFKWCIKAATKGIAASQISLGNFYRDGIGTKKKDNKAAFKWYKLAAEQGDPQAQFILGDCYLNGIGINKNEAAAFEWYKLAAEQENPQAQIVLGDCYLNGIGVGKNEDAAFEWYKKAAQHGNLQAQFILGECYRKGIGVNKNEATAFNWYKRVAEQENPEAQFILGECYRKGIGVDKNKEAACEWYKMAAKQGHLQAQFILGECYINGIGVDKNEKLAVELYQEAAKHGLAQAQFVLGCCYLKGIGVDKNEKLAVELYQEAAKQGLAQAQYNLGMCYYNGTGVDKNIKLASKWYKQAAINGNVEAQTKLKKLSTEKEIETKHDTLTIPTDQKTTKAESKPQRPVRNKNPLMITESTTSLVLTSVNPSPIQHDFTTEEISTITACMQKLTLDDKLNVTFLPQDLPTDTLRYKVELIDQSAINNKALFNKFLTSLAQSNIITCKNQGTYVELTIIKNSSNNKNVGTYTEQDVAICKKNILLLLETKNRSVQKSCGKDKHIDKPKKNPIKQQSSGAIVHLSAAEQPLSSTDLDPSADIIKIIRSILQIDPNDKRIKFIVDKKSNAITIDTEFKNVAKGVNFRGVLYNREVLDHILAQIITIYNSINQDAISKKKIKPAKLIKPYNDDTSSAQKLYQGAFLFQDLPEHLQDDYFQQLLEALAPDQLKKFEAIKKFEPISSLLLFRSDKTEFNYRYWFLGLIKIITVKSDSVETLDSNLKKWLDIITNTPNVCGINYYYIKMLDYLWTKAYGSPKKEQFTCLKNMRNALRHYRNGDLENLYATIKLLAECILINTNTSKKSLSDKSLGDLEKLKKEIEPYGDSKYSTTDNDPKLLFDILITKISFLKKYLTKKDKVEKDEEFSNNLAIVSLTNDIRELIVNLIIASHYNGLASLQVEEEEEAKVSIKNILNTFLKHKEIITYIYIVSGHTGLEQELDINETASFIKELLTNSIACPDMVSRYGFSICDTLPDGNCLFHAVLSQLTLRDLENYGISDHKSLRKKVVEYIIENQELYLQKHLIEGDFDKHVASMAKNKTWGGLPEILAMAAILKVNIVVLSNVYKEPMIYRSPDYTKAQGTIYIEYSNDHYSSLIDLDHKSLSASSSSIIDENRSALYRCIMQESESSKEDTAKIYQGSSSIYSAALSP